MYLHQSLWLKQNEPENWSRAKTVCEKQDFINFRLSGNMCTSSTNCAARWHWDSERACMDYDEDKKEKKENEAGKQVRNEVGEEEGIEKEERRGGGGEA